MHPCRASVSPGSGPRRQVLDESIKCAAGLTTALEMQIASKPPRPKAVPARLKAPAVVILHAMPIATSTC